MKTELNKYLTAARELQDKYSDIVFKIDIGITNETGYDWKLVCIEGFIVSVEYPAWGTERNSFRYTFEDFTPEEENDANLSQCIDFFAHIELIKAALLAYEKPKTAEEYQQIIAEKDGRIEFLEGELELARQQKGGAL